MSKKQFKVTNQRGFTLIEVIIYIALFSLLMGTAFVTAFQLIDGSGKLSTKNTIQEEGNFVMRKIGWALTGVKTITTPSSGMTNNLTVVKYGGTQVDICLDSGKIRMREGSSGVFACTDISYLPITTDNVTVVAGSLQFTYITPSGAGPAGITATVKIKTINTTPLDFTITKYIRK